MTAATTPLASDLRRAILRLAQRLRAERPVDGLSGAKLAALAHLRRQGPSTPSELAAAERLPPQAMTRALRELENAAFVVRRPSDGDRRKVFLEITPAGKAALGGSMAPRDIWLGGALNECSELERELLRITAPVLERLAEFDASTRALKEAK
jgi:DNA-binding MarR family transcriptional regulator